MLKTKLFMYMGKNGSVFTPIELKGLEATVYYKLSADNGKMLTKDGTHLMENITVREEEVDNWYEVDGQE